MDLAALVSSQHPVGGTAEVRRWEKRTEGSYDAGPGLHDATEVTWVRTGALQIRIGSTAHTFGAGDAIVMPPGIEHETRFLGLTQVGSVRLSRALMDDLHDVMGVARLEAGVLAAPTRLIRVAELLLEEVTSPAPGAAVAADALCGALAVEALRRAPRFVRSARPHRAIRQTLELFDTHYAEALRISDVAARVGLSRFQLSRLFREHTGRSPMAHLRDFRLQRAAVLLQEDGLSVTEVALRVGFFDLGRFGRAFKTRFGCLPREYRARR